MKKCLRCGQTYSDDTLNFCLSDGDLLVESSGYHPPPTQFADDSPPTLLINQPRVTNPIDWQGQSITPAAGQYGIAGYGAGQTQTLATWSLVLAVASFFMVCCAGGIWLGLPAAIVGFIAMRKADDNPARYGGRGMAIAGMILGIITFIISVFILIFSQLS